MKDAPLGVLIKINSIKERCGKCNKALTLETYLDPLTEKRSYRILCDNCKIILAPGDDF